MKCPKCGGGAYLSDEELVKVLENMDPVQMVARATFVCRACSEKFTRLTTDTFDGRKREDIETSKPRPREVDTISMDTTETPGKSEEEAVEGLKFF